MDHVDDGGGYRSWLEHAIGKGCPPTEVGTHLVPSTKRSLGAKQRVIQGLHCKVSQSSFMKR